VSAQIVHEVVFAAGAKVVVLACVGVAVAIAVAAVVDDASVIVRWLAFDAIVIVVGAVVIAECLLAFVDVAVGAVVVIVGRRWLQRRLEGWWKRKQAWQEWQWRRQLRQEQR